MQKTDKILVNTVKTLCLHLRWSQERLADYCDCDQAFVSRVMRGKKPITPKLRQKLGQLVIEQKLEKCKRQGDMVMDI